MGAIADLLDAHYNFAIPNEKNNYFITGDTMHGPDLPETKDSNPKDALGIKKVPLHVVPTKPLLEVGLAMMEGGRKYGTHNYRAIGVRMSTYYDAAMRHLAAWWEGEDADPDSGVSHVVKAIASLFVLRDSMHMRNCIDDRPIKYPDGINMAEFNAKAAAILEQYPACAKPFTEFAEDKPKGPESPIIGIDPVFAEAVAELRSLRNPDAKPEPFDVAKLQPGDRVKIKLKEAIHENFAEAVDALNGAVQVLEIYTEPVVLDNGKTQVGMVKAGDCEFVVYAGEIIGRA